VTGIEGGRDVSGNEGGKEPLQAVQCQHEQSGFEAHDPDNVRCPDIHAAVVANVHACE